MSKKILINTEGWTSNKKFKKLTNSIHGILGRLACMAGEFGFNEIESWDATKISEKTKCNVSEAQEVLDKELIKELKRLVKVE